MKCQLLHGRIKRVLPILIGLIPLDGCDYIEFSPFDADVKNVNYNNISVQALESIDTIPDTLRFALISDTHFYYDDLHGAIKRINTYNNLQFVICCGDITNFGMEWEFSKYLNMIKGINVPVITVIGNHDYLSNGALIYKRLFGASNMTFCFGNYRFIMFDDVVWERGNKPPNFSWLETALEDVSRTNILVAHIAPWDKQLIGDNYETYKELVNRDNTSLCLFGHEHFYNDTTFNGIHALVAASIKEREYYIVGLTGDTSLVERVKY